MLQLKPHTIALVLISATILTREANAQLSPYFEPWKPVYTIPSTPLFFDFRERTIRLPTVETYSQADLKKLVFYDVILREIADGQFDVESFSDTAPDFTCSEEKILAAVPNLSLDMSFRESNALIGCYGKIEEIEVDDELGKLITATWPNGSGIEYQLPVYGPGAYSGTRPARISSSSITISFREGEMESFMVAWASPTGECDEQILGTTFELLTLGMKYEDVVAVTECDGSITSLLVDSQGERQRIVWYERIQPFVPVVDTVSREEDENYILTADFFSGVAEQLNLFSTPFPVSLASYCTLETLTGAYQSLDIGDFESDFGVLNSCPVYTKEVNIKDGTVEKGFRWLFVDEIREVFYAKGHELTISTVNEQIVDIEFSRI